MADPSAVYCEDLGYEFEVMDADEGGYGVCVFPDGSRCEAWSFLEGTCGESYSYCARQGYDLITKTDGQNAFSTEYAVCVHDREEIGPVTELMDLSEKATRGISPAEPSPTPPEAGVSVVGQPPSFDWRNHDGQDWITAVRPTQGSCGSCWAYSAVGVTEAIYNISTGNPNLDLDLSEEYLNSDCLLDNSCCGGSHVAALEYIRVQGIPDEACLPYVSGAGCDCFPSGNCAATCAHGGGQSSPPVCSNAACGDACGDWPSRLVSIAGFAQVPADQAQIKQTLIDKGPLAVCLGVGGKFGGYWDVGDIYRCADDSGTNHCVVLVGYDDAGGYWSIKNSWGPTDGPQLDGYWKIGYGECLIESAVYYADPLATDVQVSKTDAPDPVVAGEQLYYTVSVFNAGPLPAPQVTVTDTLPGEVDFVVDSERICTEGAIGVLTCNFGNLAVGATASTTIKVMVRPDAVANAGGPTAILNEATVSSALADSDPSNNTATAATIVEDRADLMVTKLCKPDRPLLAGETATCKIYVDNLGPSDARNVRLTDANVSDGSFTIGTVTASQGTCAPPADGVVTCNLGDLPAASLSEPGRATVTIQITAIEAMDINDVATVVSETPDPDTSNNQAQGSISVTAVADLSLTKSDSPDPVVAGKSLTYTLVVKNNGPSTATNVVVADVLPPEVAVISVNGSGASSCNAGTPGDPSDPTTCTFDSLADGASRTMTIVVQVKPDAVTDVVSDQAIIHNDGRASSDTFDPDNSDNLASAATTVQARADLDLDKSAVGAPVAGQDIHYEYQVRNLGPSLSRDVTLRDLLPAGLEFLSASVDVEGGTGSVPLPCSIAIGSNELSCPLGDIGLTNGVPIIVIVNVHIRADVPKDTKLRNSADLLSDTPDPDPDPNSNSASVTVTVDTKADLSITKTTDRDLFKPSTTVKYTIRVTNNGPSDAQNVVVVDMLPPAKTGYRVFDTGYLYDPDGCLLGGTALAPTLRCDFGTLAAGASIQFDLYFRVVGNKGEVTNTVTVRSTTVDPNLANNTAVRKNLIQGKDTGKR